jgi:hypothetical protein
MKPARLAVAVAWTCVLAFSLRAQHQPGAVLWIYDATNTITSSPAIGPDGTIYVANSTGLFAVTNNSGTASNKWIFPGSGYNASTTVSLDGTIYWAAGDGDMHAISAGGSLKWSLTGGGDAAIGYDGNIYFGGYGELRAVSPGGSVQWSTPGDFSSPVIGLDGTIYVGGSTGTPPDMRLFAFSSDGSLKWAAPIDSYSSDSVAVGASGIYWLGDSLDSFSFAGQQLWSIPALGHRSPALGLDGTIYYGSGYYWMLNAVTSAGNPLWGQIPNYPRTDRTTTPAIDAAKMIHYCASNGLFTVSAQGDIQWGVTVDFIPGGMDTSAAIGPDGTIYAALGSKLYAIYATNRLADAPWPMFRQNARHTGKLEFPVLRQSEARVDGNFEFKIYADVGSAQNLEVSTDLLSWFTLTNVLVTNVPMDFVDLSATNFRTRFYRTVGQ